MISFRRQTGTSMPPEMSALRTNLPLLRRHRRCLRLRTRSSAAAKNGVRSPFRGVPIPTRRSLMSASTPSRLDGVEADMSDLRVGIGTPRNGERTPFFAAAEERVRNRKQRRCLRSRGKFVRKADISGGIDVPVCRLKEIIYPNALYGIESDPGLFQLQSFHIRDSAHAGQYVVDGDRARDVVADMIDQFLAARGRPDGDHRGVQMDLDAVARQRFGQYLGGIAFFLGQEFRLVLYDYDLRA